MPSLNRSLGLPMLLFYGVGVIVGAGIYSIVGPAAGQAGHAVWLSVLLAAVPAVLTALCYAELVGLFPRAGASYVYVREAFPRLRAASFMVGFFMALTGAATAATVALAFGGYLSELVRWPTWVTAGMLIAACTVVNVIGIRESAWVTVVCTIIEVVGLVLIIFGGVSDEDFGRGVLKISPAPVLAGAAIMFFIYTGFEGLANLAEETKRPARHVPIAMLVSLVVTVVLYVLVSLSAVALMEPRELAGSAAPLSAAAHAAAPWMGQALTWIALFSTANTALITLVVASRTLYGMAKEGDMPGLLAKTHSQRKTPWIAAIALGFAAAALLPLGRLELVGSMSSLTLLAVFIAVSAALIAIRRRMAAASEVASRGFRIAASVGRTPVVPVLAGLSAAALMTQFESAVYGLTVLIAAAGLAIYAAKRWWAPSGQRLENAP